MSRLVSALNRPIDPGCEEGQARPCRFVQWCFAVSAAESITPPTVRTPPGRIARTFARLRSEGVRGLIAYLTAGDPCPSRTVGLIQALERGGADIVELGVPFSDPIADGPVIQRASDRALKAGTSVRTVLQLVRDLREQSDVPIVVFSYLNPVLRYGFERFAEDAARAGVDGALLIDLGIEEAERYVHEMRARGLDCIFLVTQTTRAARVGQIAGHSSGFVYLVSRAGVTGVRDSISSEAILLIDRTRAATALPLAVGFGLSKREHMEAVAPHAEAAVVGSAFMRLVEEHANDNGLEGRLEALAAEFKSGLAVPHPGRDARVAAQ